MASYICITSMDDENILESYVKHMIEKATNTIPILYSDKEINNNIWENTKKVFEEEIIKRMKSK